MADFPIVAEAERKRNGKNNYRGTKWQVFRLWRKRNGSGTENTTIAARDENISDCGGSGTDAERRVYISRNAMEEFPIAAEAERKRNGTMKNRGSGTEAEFPRVFRDIWRNGKVPAKP